MTMSPNIVKARKALGVFQAHQRSLHAHPTEHPIVEISDEREHTFPSVYIGDTDITAPPPRTPDETSFDIFIRDHVDKFLPLGPIRLQQLILRHMMTIQTDPSFDEHERAQNRLLCIDKLARNNESMKGTVELGLADSILQGELRNESSPTSSDAGKAQKPNRTTDQHVNKHPLRSTKEGGPRTGQKACPGVGELPTK